MKIFVLAEPTERAEIKAVVVRDQDVLGRRFHPPTTLLR
jgi:hypothetical protein